jgi:hypothetical protein
VPLLTARCLHRAAACFSLQPQRARLAAAQQIQALALARPALPPASAASPAGRGAATAASLALLARPTPLTGRPQVLNGEYESTKELALNDWHVRKKQYTMLAIKALENECPEVLQQLVADIEDLKAGGPAGQPWQPPVVAAAMQMPLLAPSCAAAGRRGGPGGRPPGSTPDAPAPLPGPTLAAAAAHMGHAAPQPPSPPPPRRPALQVPTYFVKDLITELGRRKASYPSLKQLLDALEAQRGAADPGVVHGYYELLTHCQRKGLAAEARELFEAAGAKGVVLSAGLLKFRDTLAQPAAKSA